MATKKDETAAAPDPAKDETKGSKPAGEAKKKRTRKSQKIKVLRYIGENQDGEHLWSFPKTQPAHSSVPAARTWAVEEFKGDEFGDTETFSIIKVVSTLRTKKVQVTDTKVEELSD